VLRGSYTEVSGGRSRACRPLSLILHPPSETHADFFHADSRCFNVQLEASWSARMSLHPRALDRAADFHGGPVSHLAVKLYREFRRPDELSQLVVDGLLLEILGEASREGAARGGPAPPPWLRRARELVRARFAEKLGLACVAEEVGVHPSHLAREFRRHYRSTVGEYVRHLRVEAACRLIASSQTPLSELGLAVGFFDQGHFTRTFKRLTGITPAEFRAKLRRR
jgi:AraC family transcriptional regulator